MSQPTTQSKTRLADPTSGPLFRGWTPVSSRLNPYLPPIFITLILLVGHLSFGILENYQKTILAIVSSMVCEVVLGRLLLHKWPNLASSYITGISVGILLRSPGYWPYVVCAMLAITSKYVLRVNGRHLFNPSNFGICAMLFLASDAVATLSIQWGNNLGAMAVIWVLGSLIIWRARRFHICATYVVSFLLLSVVRAWITGDPWLSEVSPITGPEYQLFIFFMITDPKTTVRSKWGQCVVAFLVALVELFFRLGQSIYAPLYALFFVGPVALAFEMWINSRRSLVGASTTIVQANPVQP
ncbi:MAG TPA: RnfABCDGE type electron transport complex subunit D [Terracidiphilus sp.]|jgi:Na+-translocating ferredoxin:NAD+ oxidoreductase RnfD subunit|nr:RnfABCDGE type electron transport complex subunit D [Terracidiphilus sp.]